VRELNDIVGEFLAESYEKPARVIILDRTPAGAA
jgi:hypothetical protein